MAKVTPKQERFAQEYVKCLNQSEAYRRAYNVKPTTKPATVWNNSHILMGNSAVAARITQLHERTLERTLITTESLTLRLEDAITLALENDQAAAVTGAIMAQAKLNGLDVHKIEMSGKDGAPIENKMVVEFVDADND